MLAITHDFKAPLGSIMGYADLLSRLTVDGRQRFYLDNMKTSSEHLLKLVTDLLDFHRLDLHKAEINRVTFHPARLLEEIYVSFEPLTSAKGLSLKCEIDPELKGTFISDPLRLRQIVNNLLSNAVKFTSEGGITLTASFVPKGDSVFSGNHLKLSVIDTGKGMEPGDRERIFQSLPVCREHRERKDSAWDYLLSVCWCNCWKGVSKWIVCSERGVRLRCGYLCIR